MNKGIEKIDLTSDDEYHTPQSIKSDTSEVEIIDKVEIKPQALFKKFLIDLTATNPEIPSINSVKVVTNKTDTPQSSKSSSMKSSSKRNDFKPQSNTILNYFSNMNSVSADRKSVPISNMHVSSASKKHEEVKKHSEYDRINTDRNKISINNDIQCTDTSTKNVIKPVLFIPTNEYVNNKLLQWIKQELFSHSVSFKSDIENEELPISSLQSIFFESFRHICQYTDIYDCITVMKAITILKRSLNVAYNNHKMINHYGLQIADLLVSEYNEKYERVLIQYNAMHMQQLSGINTVLIGLFHSIKWIKPYESLARFSTQTTYIAFDMMKQWIDSSIIAINNHNYAEAICFLGRLQCIGNVSHSVQFPFTDAINLLHKAIKLYRIRCSNISVQKLILTLSRVITKLANEVYFICEIQHQRNYTATTSMNVEPILQKRGRKCDKNLVEFDVFNNFPSKKTKKSKETKEIDDGIKASIRETFQKFNVQSNISLIEQKVYNINHSKKYIIHNP